MYALYLLFCPIRAKLPNVKKQTEKLILYI